MSGSREITLIVMFVFWGSMLMTEYEQNNSFLNIWNVFFNLFSVFFLIAVLHNVHFVYYEKKMFLPKKKYDYKNTSYVNEVKLVMVCLS